MIIVLNQVVHCRKQGWVSLIRSPGWKTASCNPLLQGRGLEQLAELRQGKAVLAQAKRVKTWTKVPAAIGEGGGGWVGGQRAGQQNRKESILKWACNQTEEATQATTNSGVPQMEESSFSVLRTQRSYGRFPFWSPEQVRI